MQLWRVLHGLMGAWLWMLLAPLAVAAEDPDDGFGYTITVYGEPAIRQARWDVIIALKRLGWKPRRKDDGRTVFRPPRPWLGKADLAEDGTLSFRYPLVRFKNVAFAPTEPNDPTESNANLVRAPGGHVGDEGFSLPSGNAGLYLKPSRRILDGWYSKARVAVEPDLIVLRRARRDTRIKAHLESLIDDLDALWADGIPLAGGSVVPPGRRADAAIAHWSKLGTHFEGHQAARTVEIWLHNTVELTPDQLDKVRYDGRRLGDTLPTR